MPEPLLEVQGLKKHFAVGGSLLGWTHGWVKAVDGINFTINQSETLGLVGESGCGKTTTSKPILAAEEPTAGVIAFEGRNVVTFSAKELMDYRRKVQMARLFPINSAAGNASAWLSPAPSRRMRGSLSSTSRCWRWTSPFGHISSACWRRSKRAWGSAICLSPTIWRR